MIENPSPLFDPRSGWTFSEHTSDHAWTVVQQSIGFVLISVHAAATYDIVEFVAKRILRHVFPGVRSFLHRTGDGSLPLSKQFIVVLAFLHLFANQLSLLPWFSRNHKVLAILILVLLPLSPNKGRDILGTQLKHDIDCGSEVVGSSDPVRPSELALLNKVNPEVEGLKRLVSILKGRLIAEQGLNTHDDYRAYR